jgi:hypothetical protein
MPLMKSGSKQAFNSNVSKEMKAGKPQKQALAIAYATKRKAGRRKMYKGGHLADNMRDKQFPGHDSEPVMDNMLEEAKRQPLHGGGELYNGPETPDSLRSYIESLHSGGDISHPDMMSAHERQSAAKAMSGKSLNEEMSDRRDDTYGSKSMSNMMFEGGQAEMSIDPLDGQDKNADEISMRMEHRPTDTMQPDIEKHAYHEGKGRKASYVGGDKPNANGLERTFAHGGSVDKLNGHEHYSNEDELQSVIDEDMQDKQTHIRPEGDEAHMQDVIRGDRGSKPGKSFAPYGDEDSIVSRIMANRKSQSGGRSENYGMQDQSYADGGSVSDMDDMDQDGGQSPLEIELSFGKPEEDDDRDEAYASGGLVNKIMQGRKSQRVDQVPNPAEFSDNEPKDDFSLSHMASDPDHEMDDEHLDKGVIAQIMRKRRKAMRSRG